VTAADCLPFRSPGPADVFRGFILPVLSSAMSMPSVSFFASAGI
jgi:hypothetical protein